MNYKTKTFIFSKFWENCFDITLLTPICISFSKKSGPPTKMWSIGPLDTEEPELTSSGYIFKKLQCNYDNWENVNQEELNTIHFL